MDSKKDPSEETRARENHPKKKGKGELTRRHPRKEHLLRKQLLTISSRVQNEGHRRTQKRANSIQILENKRKKTRKRIGEDEKKIISISLKDNFIREREQRKKAEENPKSPFYSKYLIEHGQFYRVPDKLGQYQSNFSNLLEQRRAGLGEGRSRKSTAKGSRNAREGTITSGQKKTHKKRKRLFENLRMSKKVKEGGSKKGGKMSLGSELRPYSAPIDGKCQVTPEKKLQKWREAFHKDRNKLNSKLLTLENLNLSGKNFFTKKVGHKLAKNYALKNASKLKGWADTGNYHRLRRRPRYSLKRSMEQ